MVNWQSQIIIRKVGVYYDSGRLASASIIRILAYIKGNLFPVDYNVSHQLINFAHFFKLGPIFSGLFLLVESFSN